MITEEVKSCADNSRMIETYAKLQKQFLLKRDKHFYDYLITKRHLTQEVIDKFELGYNDHYFDMSKGEPLIAKDGITIPFRDMTGRIVAFQSRFIDNQTTADGRELRYFFTRNLPLVYERSKYIYNLDRVLTHHYNRSVVIVEGVFDLISLVIAGVNNVVTPLQNMVGVEIAEILWRYFDRVYFLMDKGKTGEQILNFKNKRMYDLELYKIPVKDINGMVLKDANDMLKAGIDIRQYMKDNRELVTQTKEE
jgi:DNA primase